MRPRVISAIHRAAIRELFLHRRTEYTTQQAANLLRLNVGEVLALIDAGSLHANVKRKRRQLGGRKRALITWHELASAAMLRWTVMQINDALGERARNVLPRLLWPVELESVRLPEYQVRLITVLAEHEGVSFEEFVHNALLHVETAKTPEEMERLVPCIRDALAFPDVPK